MLEVKVGDLGHMGIRRSQHATHVLLNKGGVGLGVEDDIVAEVVGVWGLELGMVEKSLEIVAGVEFDTYFVGTVVVNDGALGQIVVVGDVEGTFHEVDGHGAGALGHERGPLEPEENLVGVDGAGGASLLKGDAGTAGGPLGRTGW